MTKAETHIPGHMPGAVKSFTCPQCGGTIAIRAAGISITAVCEHCRSVIDVANENLVLIQKARKNTRGVPLPLGSRGTLSGVPWEVIGYMERGDFRETYAWREYLLFNPWQGFRFLVESDGHWSFVTTLRRSLAPWFNSVSYRGERYRLFNTTNAKVLYVMGEFYWRVKMDDKAYLADYVAPPGMLSLEQTYQEINWSYGVYTASEAVRQAFGISGDWPAPRGIAPNQPNKYVERMGRYGKFFLISCLALMLGQYVSSSASRNQIILNESYQIQAQELGKPVVLGPFTLPGDKENVELEVRSPVNNSWFELEADLVNTQTQEHYSVLETVEYYTGYDSDGAWSEGGQQQSAVLSSVSGGIYQLVITPNGPATGPYQTTGYQVALRRDVTVWSNFLLALVGIAFMPLLTLMRKSAFEKARWEESDTSAEPRIQPPDPPDAPQNTPPGDTNAALNPFSGDR